MVIYADVLIIVNIIVDYFILLLTATFSKSKYKNFRLLLGALIGGLSSMYIFLPQQHFLVEISYRSIVAVLIILTSFGFKKFKNFARAVVCFLLSTVVYGGSVMVVWLIFKPNSIVINNSYVYYDISATYLIIFSVVIYLIISVIKTVLKREAVTAKRCELTIKIKNISDDIMGILDTGNSVKDFLSDSPIFFVSDNTFIKLFGAKFDSFKDNLKDRYRLIPCKTVNNDGLLEGLRCDKAIVKTENGQFDFSKPILLKNYNKFSDDFDAIINPEILLR